MQIATLAGGRPGWDAGGQAFATQSRNKTAHLARPSATCPARPSTRSVDGEATSSTTRLAAGSRELDLRSQAFERQVGDITSQLDHVNELVGTPQRERARAARPARRKPPAGDRQPPARSPTPPSTCARRWPAPRPVASGASAWPTTCCAPPASSRASTTGSRRRSPAARSPTSRFLLPGGRLAAHGREVPDRQLPPPPRGRHRRRARRGGQGRSSATCATGSRSSRAAATSTPTTTVDELLLFIPNESVYGVHPRARPASCSTSRWRQKVVLCSPFTLFAVLAVIRQAVDQTRLERTSDEILDCLSALPAAVGRSSPSGRQAWASVRHRAEGPRRAGRHPPPPARAPARPDRRPPQPARPAEPRPRWATVRARPSAARTGDVRELPGGITPPGSALPAKGRGSHRGRPGRRGRG